MVNKIFFLFIAAFLIYSCAGGPYYSYNYPLSDELYFSKDKTLKCNIPAGWFFSEEISHLQFLLLRDDLKARISLQELNVDDVTKNRIIKGKLELLGEISAAFKKESTEKYKQTKDVEVFYMGKKNYCGYEYYSDETSGRIRVVVFNFQNRFFECSAIPSKGNWIEIDLRQLYNVMHTFIVNLQNVQPI